MTDLAAVVAAKKSSSDAVLSLLSEVAVSKGLLTKSIACASCSDRLEISYAGLSGDPDAYLVWEVLGEVTVLCAGCSAKFADDPIQGSVSELSRVTYEDPATSETVVSWLAPETAIEVVRKINDAIDDGIDVRVPSVEHGAATQIRHFAHWRALRGA
ncbi:hypothetical protein nbrc107696_42630 [Gordonia spumicola]|uniref:Uncharacterized protein n=1 Tax=Gordonia spumicola TaxID=589161 RepID=A0A7I9VER4_9ACTN|nr:hypothetical protein [Gordonia spumicola]GEE03817.1 hypothetical protein nbrc107696_42630 [Gordonia spumicola]